jgi:hypothetical protein
MILGVFGSHSSVALVPSLALAPYLEYRIISNGQTYNSVRIARCLLVQIPFVRSYNLSLEILRSDVCTEPECQRDTTKS